MIQPQVLLLKEGTDTSQGRGQLISNINACTAVADILRTTLGPLGMDKLISKGDNSTISNDGATIIRLLDIVHPAAKTLTEIAKSQDDEIGDGTTSVVLLTAELLLNAKEFVEEGVHVQSIISGYQKACSEALKHLPLLSLDLETADLSLFKEESQQNENPKKFLLKQCAKTSLTSKLIEGDKDFFAEMVVGAFLRHGRSASRDFLTVKTVSGGSVKDSFLLSGIAFKKTFSYAGFEQQPKSFTSPRIALLNVELELKSENMSAEVRVSPENYKSIVDAEWKILYDKLEIIADSKADVVLSKLPIGDLATQFFAGKKMFCAGRVPEGDLQRLSALSGGVVVTSLKDLGEESLGKCKSFEEKQLGKERINFFYGDDDLGNEKLSTIVLRGGAEQYIEEASRSLNDAIMVVKNTMAHPVIVPGAGAIEMELSRRLKQYSQQLKGAESFFVSAFARALEVIPRALSTNAGIDSTDILNHLRRLHHSEGGENMGVDLDNDTTCDALKTFVWEPMASKRNILQSATEAASLILSVDETVRAPKSEAGGSGMMPPRM